MFSPDQTPGTRLLRVPSAGGKAEAVGVARGGRGHPAVAADPAGRQRPCSIRAAASAGAYNDANLVVQPLPGGARRSSSAAAITAGICQAAIWSTSTMGRSSRRRSISSRLEVTGEAGAGARRSDVERRHGRRAVCRVRRAARSCICRAGYRRRRRYRSTGWIETGRRRRCE